MCNVTVNQRDAIINLNHYHPETRPAEDDHISISTL